MRIKASVVAALLLGAALLGAAIGALRARDVNEEAAETRSQTGAFLPAVRVEPLLGNIPVGDLEEAEAETEVPASREEPPGRQGVGDPGILY